MPFAKVRDKIFVSDLVAETCDACDRTEDLRALRFLYINDYSRRNMTETALKPFLTYEEQINNLVERKGMVISNRKYAFEKLEDISYFSLIDGYKNLFYNPMTRRYKPGTTFEDIVALYEFDEKLRALVFKYLCHFEQKMRSLISYYFCDTYSEKQEDYLDITHYNDTQNNKQSILRLIAILEREAKKNSDHVYVVYQRKKYGNVPLWVIINTLTFGQISKMYSLLTISMKAKISMHFRYVNEKELIQYMKVLTLYRNVCAHNERLFSYKSRFDIPNTEIHKKMKLPQKGTQYTCGKNDLFSVVITFRMLLSTEDFSQFKKSFNLIIKQYIKNTENISQKTFLQTMGLPENWNHISKYKL